MKKLIHWGCLLAFLFIGVSQVSAMSLLTDTINKTDEQGFKQGYWIVVNEESGNDCPPNQKLEEGRYINNRKTGEWRYYYCSGKLKSIETNREDRTKYCKNYYPSGALMEEGVWAKGAWTGNYKYYYESGKLYFDFQFSEDGKRNGVQKYFHENGNIMVEGTWVDSKESGLIREYHPNGSLASEKTFNEGKLDEASVKNFAPKAVEQKQEVVQEVKPQEPPPPPADLELMRDGFHKTFVKGTRLLEQEGEFKSGKLQEGKRYVYKDGKIFKTQIVREGKVVKTVFEKEQDENKD
jgi:antitoxin component YwqK of YwqJK toxin-antitoxin module